MTIRQSALFAALILALSACGVNGGGKTFSAFAQNDIIQANLTDSSTIEVDPMGNDGGSGKFIEDVTQGWYGSVAINPNGTLTYTPHPVAEGTAMVDWFEYRIRTNNYAYDVGRVSIRFTDFDSDKYEPDDFQEYARGITLNYGIPRLEQHTSDVTNQASNGTDPFAGSGQTIAGDEDWMVVDIPPAPTAGLVPWIRIESRLPAAPAADHNAVVITMMDQWGFVATDLLGNNLIESSNGGGFDATGNGDGTELDRGIAPGRYLIRVNPEFGHHGEYDLRFTLYENAPPVVAAPVGISSLQVAPDQSEATTTVE